jgi:hypothetical protein
LRLLISKATVTAEIVSWSLADAYRQRDCRRRRGVEGLTLLDAGLPLAQFLGGLALVGRRSATSETGACDVAVRNTNVG